MIIAIGSDHHGVVMRSDVQNLLTSWGYTVREFGPSVTDNEPVDYPDIAAEVASLVSRGEAERGILICGTGLGMSIVANKFPRVRAAAIWDEFTADLCRRHNDLNVLCLSADMMSEGVAQRIIKVWLETPFDGGRHARRVDKITAIEDGWKRSTV
ncbi:MAG: ribose 5-phosphate isomerase B [Thermoguttaceae bacterium]